MTSLHPFVIALNRSRRVSFAALSFIVAGASAFAGSATWKTDPHSSDWNTANNWSPGTVPNGPSDTATFAQSNVSFVNLSAGVEVNTIVFAPGATAFSIHLPAAPSAPVLSLSGAGVVNNSGVAQDLVAQWGADFGSPSIIFLGQAAAGSNVTYTAQGGAVPGTSGGTIQFFGTSQASDATFTIDGASNSEAGAGSLSFFEESSAGNGQFTINSDATTGTLLLTDSANAGVATFDVSGLVTFFGDSTADSANFAVNGGATGESGGGFVLFSETTSAENATFTGTGGAVQFAGGATIYFSSASAAGSATLIAYGDVPTAGGATIYLADSSSGGAAAVKVYGRGNLDIDFHDSSGVTIGSLEGNGAVYLGSVELAVGSNNSSTTFSGIMQDGGTGGGTGGSLTKVGTGALTLAGPNIHTGGTRIEAGELVVTTRNASPAGPGPVQVNAGILSGTSKLSGSIRVGRGAGSGAFLSPGVNGIGTLSTAGNLTFKADGNYVCELRPSRQDPRSDQISAREVTIDGSAQITLVSLSDRRLASGTVFTIIADRSSLPISGTFANLPNGSSVTLGSNTYVVSYEGGDGNDLTLTVQ